MINSGSNYVVLNRSARRPARYIKKSISHFQSDDLTLSYQLIREFGADYPVERLCKILRVSRSAYYAYQAGQSYSLTKGEEKLRQAVVESFTEHRRRYGSRRLLTELQEKGYEIGRHLLRRIMQEADLKAIQPRSFIPRTTDSRHHGPFSPNLLLDMDFPTEPGRVLVGDITARAAPLFTIS